ncbi:MAG: hypothetical protein ACHQ1H_07160, partial [Nitrososphaerales archaeon]
MSNLGTVEIFAVLVLFMVSSLSVMSTYAVNQEVSSPLGLQFSFRIDPASNHWYVHATNVGIRSLGQVAFLLFNRAGNEITSNSTLLMGKSWLRSDDSINFNTVCNQSGAPCKFHSGAIYQLEVIAWIGTCSCDEQLQLTGNVSANNKVYSFDTYPMIVL